ncbi:MAG: phosphoribosylformylglycinamidine synthase subunit PurS [Candidatus Binataceae bacterium]
MNFQIKVLVTPKRGILDPQGRAVEQSLKSLGFNQVDGVRIGKYIALSVEAASAAAAREIVTRMCEQLLANTVIEDYRFEVEAG